MEVDFDFQQCEKINQSQTLAIHHGRLEDLAFFFFTLVLAQKKCF